MKHNPSDGHAGLGGAGPHQHEQADRLISLARHELAHALAFLKLGAGEVRIEDDGDEWTTTPFEISAMTDESFMRVTCAGMLYPEHLSSTDRDLIDSFPRKDREAAIQWCEEHIRPRIESISNPELAHIAEKVQNGGITLRKSRMH